MNKFCNHNLLFIALLLLFSCTSNNKLVQVKNAVTSVPDLSTAVALSASVIPEKPDNAVKNIKGYKEVSSLMKAYPGTVSGIRREGDDISFLVRDKRFYFSGGKLLPEELRNCSENYRSYGFYYYPENIPPLIPPDSEKLEKIKQYVSDRGSTARDNTFLGELYSGHSFNDILEEIRYINFLNFRIEVHRELIPRFKAVERDILLEAEKDPELKRFLTTLKKGGAFNWRRANGSRSRSYHSYGIAVDFTPESFGRNQVFWDWSRKFNNEWYNIPYSERWMLNEKFISIFERQGFVWGGKWLYFDNMHFEYRPEILILSGREVASPGN